MWLLISSHPGERELQVDNGKPHTVLGHVEASDWSFYAFADVAKANALAELNNKAKAMGADEIVDVQVANNCWWAWIIIFPTCQSEAVGTAIKYQ